MEVLFCHVSIKSMKNWLYCVTWVDRSISVVGEIESDTYVVSGAGGGGVGGVFLKATVQRRRPSENPKKTKQAP